MRRRGNDSFLGECLQALNPDKRFEIFGVDLAHAPMQEAGVVERAAARNSNIRLLSRHAGLPFEDGTLDIIVSNQVLEHLDDLPQCMRETRRTLCPGGTSINLFPLKHV
jgi:ubiquinone/menaquinone biosynthesis C-methylase UbiE